jgi:hypothetical protein
MEGIRVDRFELSVHPSLRCTPYLVESQPIAQKPMRTKLIEKLGATREQVVAEFGAAG